MEPVEPVAAAQPLLDPFIQLGIVGILVLALAWVVRYLYRRMEAILDARISGEVLAAKEREMWAVERQKTKDDHDLKIHGLKLEYEIRHRELSEKYSQQLSDVLKQSREAEKENRREIIDTLEGMSVEQAKTSAASALVIDKLTERIIAGGKGA